MLKFKYFILGSLCVVAVSANALKCESEFGLWMSFEEAKAFIRKEGITSATQFRKWSASGQRPENFPSAPNRTYEEEWTSWGDFLGTGNISNSKKQWMSFEKAKAFIQKEGFISKRQFRKWSRSEQRPKDFPSTPDKAYPEEWTNWSDFLGIENISNSKKRWMSFEEAKAFIQKEEMTSMRQFQKWRNSEQRPKNFPSNPNRTYKEEWTSWGDFLGTGNISNSKKRWMSFEEAKAFIQKEGFISRRQFQKWSGSEQRPKNFSKCPQQNLFRGMDQLGRFLRNREYIKQQKTLDEL